MSINFLGSQVTCRISPFFPVTVSTNIPAKVLKKAIDQVVDAGDCRKM
jgi:hypothetical protein